MKNYFGKLLLLLPVALLVSCLSGEERALQSIRKMEAALHGNDASNYVFDETKAGDLLAAYLDFASRHPQNKQTPEVMFNAAALHRALKEYESALGLYKKLEMDYPDYEKIPHAIFLQGFVYEENLRQYDKAKERYETFLKRYPGHDLSDDAEFSLKNLGRPAEDLIREFERMNQPEAGGDEAGASTN